MVDMKGSAEFAALIENRDGVLNAIVSQGDSLPDPGVSGAKLNRFVSVRVSGQNIALRLFPESGGSSLYIERGEGLQYLLPSTDRYISAEAELKQAPVFDDGCRVYFADQGSYSFNSKGDLFLDTILRPEQSSQANQAVCPRRFTIIDARESCRRDCRLDDQVTAVC